MKKLLGILILWLLLTSNVKAEWFFLQDIETGGRFYTDIKTLKNDGEYIYIWTLQDLDEAIITGKDLKALSVKKYEKIDCKLSRAQTLQYIFYAGNMGTGKPKNFQRDKLEWLYFPPKTMMGEFIRILCKDR